MPDGYLRLTRSFADDVAYWRYDGGDGHGDVDERDGIVIASLARPYGSQLLAYELGCDVDEFGVKVAYDEAVEQLFGGEADELLRVRHLEVDATTRSRFVRELATVYRLLDDKLHRNAGGDYAPDVAAARFPDFVPPTPQAAPPRSPRGSALGIGALFDLWRAARAPSLAASTIRRYGPAVASLNTHSSGKDVRSPSEDDLWAWANSRVASGASARTVNRNELVAIASLLNWATTREGAPALRQPRQGRQAAGAEDARAPRAHLPQRRIDNDPDARALGRARPQISEGRRESTMGALDLRLFRYCWRMGRLRRAPSRVG